MNLKFQINSALSGKYKVLNNGTLQVIGLDKEDAGQYRCTASNEVGDPAHRDIHLTVTGSTGLLQTH